MSFYDSSKSVYLDDVKAKLEAQAQKAKRRRKHGNQKPRNERRRSVEACRAAAHNQQMVCGLQHQRDHNSCNQRRDAVDSAEGVSYG